MNTWRVSGRGEGCARSGFTIIELAIVVVVAGLLLVPLLRIAGSSIISARLKETQSRLDTARDALVAFAAVNGGCLPFASDFEGGLPDTDASGCGGHPRYRRPQQQPERQRSPVGRSRPDQRVPRRRQPAHPVLRRHPLHRHRRQSGDDYLRCGLSRVSVGFGRHLRFAIRYAGLRFRQRPGFRRPHALRDQEEQVARRRHASLRWRKRRHGAY